MAKDFRQNQVLINHPQITRWPKKSFRVNINRCKTAIWTYFMDSHWKIWLFQTNTFKDFIVRKNIFVNVQYLAQLQNYKYFSLIYLRLPLETSWIEKRIGTSMWRSSVRHSGGRPLFVHFIRSPCLNGLFLPPSSLCVLFVPHRLHWYTGTPGHLDTKKPGYQDTGTQG